MTTTSARSYYGPQILAEEIGLQRWQFERASAAGLLPRPEHTRGWTPEQAEQIRNLVPAIVGRFGAEHPIGAARCADRLAARLAMTVQPCDIEALAEAGHLEVADTFTKGGRTYDLYAPAHVDALPAESVAAILTARTEWTAVSVTADDACAHLGWKFDELTRVAHERRIATGRLGRYRRADIDALAADEDLCEQIRLDRVMTADAAAGLLDVERRHFDIAVENAWIRPVRHHDKEVGRYRTVAVPLYRTGDIEALLELPDVDWAQVRATPKGVRSPLLELVGGRKLTRAKAIRSFLQWFGADHGIEMWGWWVPGPDLWEIDWERIDGGPTKQDVAAAIEGNPALRRYRRDIQLHSHAGAAIRFAREMLAPGAAVILDTETTDLFGRVCEIAIIDACTGRVLLDSLVNPGCPISPDAIAIHGIGEGDVTAPGVPDWKTIYPRVLKATKGRTILAYNADYDRTVVAADCRAAGITRSRLADPARWADVMVPRSDHARIRDWLPNGGGHRALADVQETRRHLQRMTAP
ncbi:Exodeoxyribonuclease 10 [Nocardia otitidiscaviarum]|uniref:Exodeoxyribonuclease 10 n=1 Tax=Nocardia otitidiscaviarum TaxID=1823 RepID=A0A379JLW4_9NOCA|nr:3'-5' exonuclease [Nocardia otitidiscaviarum]SUD49511.1 Exodeoxyribonuclease 10 [Nocardia otitidiscaviarum]SUD49607.1 Exodeoxyribonuclease 10 [Nocardia otitidiscaviarum]